MVYNKFQTFTTSYYFPPMGTEHQYMYGLYSAYGGILSKTYWWLFRHSAFVRRFTEVDESVLPFAYADICRMDDSDSLMAFNMGSPGVEQKISILGYDRQACQPFFAKFSQKEKAMALTRHEASIYRTLHGTHLTPNLLMFKESESGIYMKTEYVKGMRPETKELDENIVAVARQLGQCHIDGFSIEHGTLKTCLSHGDFCPWNFLVDGNAYRLIDWELAAERPLGYDLFTYICNVSALFEPKKLLIRSILDNEPWLLKYFADFGVSGYIPYLKAFATEKATYERSKNNSVLALPYEMLLETL